MPHIRGKELPLSVYRLSYSSIIKWSVYQFDAEGLCTGRTRNATPSGGASRHVNVLIKGKLNHFVRNRTNLYCFLTTLWAGSGSFPLLTETANTGKDMPAPRLWWPGLHILLYYIPYSPIILFRILLYPIPCSLYYIGVPRRLRNACPSFLRIHFLILKNACSWFWSMRVLLPGECASQRPHTRIGTVSQPASGWMQNAVRPLKFNTLSHFWKEFGSERTNLLLCFMNILFSFTIFAA